MKKILFHGTNDAEEILNEGFQKSNISLYGRGVYFFQSKSYAKAYGKQILRSEVMIRYIVA